MFQEDGSLDPTTKSMLQKGTSLVTLLGPPLALGAVSSLIIGGLGLGAAATAAVAVPAAGKLVSFLQERAEKKSSSEMVLPENGELPDKT